MTTSPLIVPTVLTTGNLHFAEVSQHAIANDVIKTLIAVDGVISEILGGLQDAGWALQRVRSEQHGRNWEEEELEALGDGAWLADVDRTTNRPYISIAVLSPDAPISPLVNKESSRPSMQRHFSSFPLTSHLHAPVLRLVSLNSLLSIQLEFLRVPEIHDHFRYKMFLARSTTVSEVIEAVIDELGLAKSLPIPGAGALNYVLEEVWLDDEHERKGSIVD
jgi:diaphanous 1